MVLLHLIGKREVQKILNELETENLTAAELNDRIVIRDSLCSTSSLYRRLTELSLTGLIRKQGHNYSLTIVGEKIRKGMLDKFDPQLDSKLRGILIQFLKSKHSVSDLLDTMKISPNELTKALHYLQKKNYLNSELRHHMKIREELPEKHDEKRLYTSRGRPSKVYRLTKKGKKSLDDLDEFEESLK